MLKYEEPAIEQAALSGEMYIAIPVEVYQNAADEVQLTTYAACEETAKAFLSDYGADPFRRDALSWLASRMDAFMTPYGYRYNSEASRVILEYTAENDVLRPPKVRTISIKNLDEWLQYENKTDVDPDFTHGGKGIAFAVEENGCIVSCACTNDAFYADGAVEIHVETAPEYQNRGFGYSCVASLVYCLTDQGYKVWYKCYETNFASAAIAQKCGLRLTGRRISFVCYADV